VLHRRAARLTAAEYCRTLHGTEARLPWSAWYQDWRAHRLRSAAASEYETAHHPVAVLVCVTRAQLAASTKLWDVRRAPPYWPKYMDSNLPVHYLLVSDAAEQCVLLAPRLTHLFVGPRCSWRSSKRLRGLRTVT
jgi:hypothetical protein